MKNLSLKSQAFQYVEKSFREWLDILGYAPSTVYCLPNHVRELLYWMECQGLSHLHQLEIKLIQKYYAELKSRPNIRRGGGLSNAYLNKHLQALYKFAEYLRQSGRLVLPSLNIEWEAGDGQEIEYLTQEEIKELFRVAAQPMPPQERLNESFLEAIAYRDVAMLTIFYSCGLRRNEGYSLDLSDIDFDRCILYVRKGKAYKERLVPFNKTASTYLQEWVYDWRPVLLTDKREGAFFISQRGRRMEPQTLSLRLKLLQHRSDHASLKEKNVRLHVLRHSIATHLLQNGMPLENIGRFLGHSSLESTQVYTHLNQDGNG
jgi:integrase/recombinase XerD